MFLRNDDKNLSDLYRSIYKESWEGQDMESPIEPTLDDDKTVNGIKPVKLTKEEFIPFRAKLHKAKQIVKQKSPALWYILEGLSLVPHEDKRLDTMAVDDIGNIYINIYFMMMEVDLDEAAGVLAHEACHIQNGTFSRQRGRNRKLWNYATDYTMNLALLTAGYKLPALGLIPVLVDGRYHAINKNFGWNIDIHDMIVLKIRDKKDLSTICLANNNLQIALKLSKELDVALKKLPELMSSLTNTLIEVNSFYNCIKTVEDLNVQLNLKLQKQNINFKEIVKRATANAASTTNHYDNMVRNAKCYPI